MIARFHYDRNVYRQLLDDELPITEEQDVTTHIESCPECQDALESISKDQVDWSSVPDLLTRESKPPHADRLQRANILSPSDRPNSLGRFGRYEIVEYLGGGGMGLVLKGYDSALNRYSAIKVLAPVLATSASARQRFAREAKSAAAVVHEHVLPIQTVDEENGLPYLVMPVIEGKSVQQRVDADGPLKTKEILRIGMQIASGLAAAHSHGLVHRDVKPANVLLENGLERVMLTDFGLARAADDAHMTQSGVITGTPQYMSPEQAQGLEVDQRSDLFSLGSVLYYMSTGHSPFRATTTFGVLNRIINEEHRPVRQANSEIPAWLANIIDRLLEKEKSRRLESAAEVSELLSCWLAHLQQPQTVNRPPVPSAPASGRGNRNRTKQLLLAAVGGFLLLLAGFVINVELSKGTLTITCPVDDLSVRIMEGDRIVDKLDIKRNAASTRIAAGKYVVEIDGPSDGLELKDETIILSRGETAIAEIVNKTPETNEDVVANAKIPRKGALVEFIDGTDIMVVRGQKEHVDRIMKVMDPKQEDTDQASEPAEGNQPEPKDSSGMKKLNTAFAPKDGIVFVGADWSLSAAMMKPTLEELGRQGHHIYYADADKSRFGRVLAAESVPNLVVFKNGRKIASYAGLMNAKLIRDFVRSNKSDHRDTRLDSKHGQTTWSPEVGEALYMAADSYAAADTLGAKTHYEKAFAAIGRGGGGDFDDGLPKIMVNHIARYFQILNKLDEDAPPKDFSLTPFVEEIAKDLGYGQDVSGAFRKIAEDLRE